MQRGSNRIKCNVLSDVVCMHLTHCAQTRPMNVRPLNGWACCRALKNKETTSKRDVSGARINRRSVRARL